MKKQRSALRYLTALSAILNLLEMAGALSVDHIFFNCSINTNKYFSQPEFACNDCGSNQQTLEWRACQCSAGFRATETVRQSNQGLAYPCSGCTWASDAYCRPADSSGCTQYTTIKKIVGFEERSPFVCMPCKYGETNEYSCRCPTDTPTIRYKPAFPSLCIETNPSQELRATWQVIGNLQSLTFKCMLQKVDEIDI